MAAGDLVGWCCAADGFVWTGWTTGGFAGGGWTAGDFDCSGVVFWGVKVWGNLTGNFVTGSLVFLFQKFIPRRLFSLLHLLFDRIEKFCIAFSADGGGGWRNSTFSLGNRFDCVLFPFA